MTAETILRDLTAHGAILMAVDGVLDIEAPDDLLTDDLLDTLRAHKAEILALLSAPDPQELGPGYCRDCTGKLNLQDRARDAWYCPNCRTWCDRRGQPLLKLERVRPLTLEEQQARQLLDDLRAAGCGFVLGGEFGDELQLTYPTRMPDALWVRFENAGPDFRRLAREEAERQAAAEWEGEAGQWIN